MTTTIPVTFAFQARAVGRMRNEVSVTGVEPAGTGTHELATDEGAFHGGDATAPTPLHLFTAALAGCLMTQLRAFANRLDVPLDRLEVSGTARWEARAEPRRPYVSTPLDIDMAIDVETTATQEQVLELITAAKRGCFIEQSLALGLDVRHTVTVGGRVIDVENYERTGHLEEARSAVGGQG